jgi:hypothetical protein
MHVFIDESGDLGANDIHEYFVLGMIFCENNSIVKTLNQVIKKHNYFLWKNGWPKNVEIKANHLFNYKVIPEVKNSNIKINPKLYLQTIYRDINQLNIKAGFIIHKPENQGIEFKCLNKEKIYNFLSKKLYIACFRNLISPLFITVDQRNTTLVKKDKMIDRNIQRLNLSYQGYIENELTYQFATWHYIQPEIEIEFGDSKRIKGLQVVDYLSWAIRKKYEGKSYWANLINNIERIEEIDNF